MNAPLQHITMDLFCIRNFEISHLNLKSKAIVKQGKIVAKLLPTKVTVRYKPYCVYSQKKSFKA